MITLSRYRGQAVGVFGLGKAGAATTTSLLAGGANVYAWDDAEASREALRRTYSTARILPIAQWPWRALASLVLSPGVPLTHPGPHPAVNLAHKAQVEIIGDIELLFRACPRATYIGITGTNGKSTTTTLVSHILKSAGRRVETGGNLGTPALSLAPLGDQGIYVLELSSYQLDLLKSARFHVAALLNVTPDHLDRHGDMEGYFAAKRHIFDRQKAEDVAVIAAEDAYTLRAAKLLAAEGEARVVKVAAQPLLHGIDLREISTLTGRHNWQNAAVAYAAVHALGVPHQAIADALRSFPGLSHRMELVDEVRGIRFVNDSKATNAEATANALAAYDAIYWILGGKPKAGGIEALTDFFPRIRHAFLIGEASEAFAKTLDGRVEHTRCGTLDVAVQHAAAMALAHAAPQAVVLLSPACASFDQFRNFEERGEKFRQLVANGEWRAAGDDAHPPLFPSRSEQRHAS
ncbi:MAG: UDP-N-acetylmuramoyl-L-alanine--D-glutamate ligase [Alphaproteobacteria bacterium]|nr:UDP-N-acetylmuramoyl-L-alanine--D-glutamate ligase [Alphaproteobacteria bacterium]